MWAADIQIHPNNMNRVDIFSLYGHKSLSPAA